MSNQPTRRIEVLRRRRCRGLRIAEELRLAVQPVGLWLRRLGLGRLKNLEPKPVVVRYGNRGAGMWGEQRIRCQLCQPLRDELAA